MPRIKRLWLGIGLGWSLHPTTFAEGNQFRYVRLVKLLRLNNSAQGVALPCGAIE